MHLRERRSAKEFVYETEKKAASSIVAVKSTSKTMAAAGAKEKEELVASTTVLKKPELQARELPELKRSQLTKGPRVPSWRPRSRYS